MRKLFQEQKFVMDNGWFGTYRWVNRAWWELVLSMIVSGMIALLGFGILLII